MSKKNTCVLLYSSQQSLEQDIDKLQTHNFNMKSVSIVGRGQMRKNHTTKSCVTNEKTHFQNNQRARLNAAGGFLFHEFGAIVAAGSIVHLLAKDHEDTGIVSGLRVLTLALFSFGIPMNSIRQYEKSVNAGKCLLIIHGSLDDVERACQLLHSETQQVTVHMA